MKKEHYVYKHVGKRSKEVFYIGAGKGRRCYDKRHNNDWIKKVEKENGYEIIILENQLSKKEAFEIEQKLIDEIGLNNLTNMTSNRGNSTSFKRGLIPWNKGKKNCQNYAIKKVKVDGVIYDSVKEAISSLEIGKTTFYRWVKRNKVEYV